MLCFFLYKKHSFLIGQVVERGDKLFAFVFLFSIIPSSSDGDIDLFCCSHRIWCLRALHFTTFQLQLVEIDHWKKENEKRRDEYADLQREMERKISEKEKGMQYLVDEVSELKDKLANLERTYEERIAAREKEVQHEHFLKDEEYKKLERDTQQMARDNNQLKLDLAAAIADGQRIDPEKVRLAKLAEDNAVTIAEGQRAIDVMVVENEEQRKRAREMEEQCARDVLFEWLACLCFLCRFSLFFKLRGAGRTS